MTPQSVPNLLRARMQDFARLHPALALVEYDCINGQLGWTSACSDSLGIPIFLQPLSLRRWLSLFDRATRKMMWRACTTLLAQRSTGHVLDLPAVTLADGRTFTLTTQIDISYAPDQRPTRMSAIVLHQGSADAALPGSWHHSGRRAADTTVKAPFQNLLESRGHALRGPLGAIAAAVEVLRIGVGNERIRERALQIIDRQTQQLTRLIAAMDDLD